jgi:uncharacterized glyoxalase superfamily protein PhnB
MSVNVRTTGVHHVAGDAFSPHRVGIDHMALACSEETELERVAAALAAAGVENTEPKMDLTFVKRYVAVRDPDCIAWERYMARVITGAP